MTESIFPLTIGQKCLDCGTHWRYGPTEHTGTTSIWWCDCHPNDHPNDRALRGQHCRPGIPATDTP